MSENQNLSSDVVETLTADEPEDAGTLDLQPNQTLSLPPDESSGNPLTTNFQQENEIQQFEIKLPTGENDSSVVAQEEILTVPDENAINGGSQVVCQATEEEETTVAAKRVETVVAQQQIPDENAIVDGSQVVCEGTEEQETQTVPIEEPPEAKREGEFSVSDLVWGKVKSHPWWPGQIFKSSDASDRALKYKKRDSFLVAYFGDQTFAWNEPSSLTHFQTHFSQMENQSSSDSFSAAVHYALDEVFRRVLFGMSCSCTPKLVKPQVVVNAGIRKDVKRKERPDISLGATSFQPDKLLRVVKDLALNPYGGSDRLELKIAHAQLLSFSRFKGFSQLPEFYGYGGLLEDISLSGETNDSTPGFRNGKHVLTDEPKSKSRESSSRKRKYGSDGGLHPSKKKKNLSDLNNGRKATSPVTSNGTKILDEGAPLLHASSFGRKRKAVHPFSEDSTLKNIKRMASSQSDFDTEAPSPQSFKVGECIRRIASQLSGSPPILKHSSLKVPRGSAQLDGNEYDEYDEFDASHTTPKVPQRKTRIHSKNYPSPTDEMLSQLCLAAQDPLEGYSFLTTIIGFFSDFRNSISIEYSDAVKRKRSDKMVGVEPGNSDTRCNTTFDFEDMGDSYWTDRIIQSSPEEQPTRRRKTQGQSSFGLSTEFYTSFEAEDPLQLIVSDLEEQNHDEDYVLAKEKTSRKYRKKKKISLNVLPTDKNASSSPINHDVAEEFTSRSTKDKHINDISLTELLMGFTEPASIPSVIKLNNIFRRFGPLKESETKVLKDTNSARVVFRKQTDAEVACNSAAKFSIFGAVHVHYQLRYQM